ncbi:hypothetical protein GH733_012228, partial [Mirounga leonina]
RRRQRSQAQRGCHPGPVDKRLRQEPVPSCCLMTEESLPSLSQTFPNGSSPRDSPVVPYNAPTPCYHPSTDSRGNICPGTLKDKGSAQGDVRAIPVSIQSLRRETNTEGPLHTHAAELWKNPQPLRSICKKPQSRSPARNPDWGAPL